MRSQLHAGGGGLPCLPRLTKAETRIFEFLQRCNGEPVLNREIREFVGISQDTLRIGLKSLNKHRFIQTISGGGRTLSRHVVLVTIVLVVPNRVDS